MKNWITIYLKLLTFFTFRQKGTDNHFVWSDFFESRECGYKERGIVKWVETSNLRNAKKSKSKITRAPRDIRDVEMLI